MTTANIPSHLTIRVLYSDDDIIVIDKPCDLRSVPGHASPPPPEKAGPRSTETAGAGEGGGDDDDENISQPSPRRTAQEAWVQAIHYLKNTTDIVTNSDCGEENEEGLAASAELLCNLGTTADPSCVPRKLNTFIKYCHRNSKRLLPSFPMLHDSHKNVSKNMFDCEQPKQKKLKVDNIIASSSTLPLGRIAHACFVKIQKEQRLLMNLPKPTEDWESAIGQLRILGFGDYSHCVSSTISEHDIGAESKKLFVVHRLDCQTSGIMVVARNQETASSLSRAWRERESVHKVYLAHVRHWPPYHKHGVSEGTIDLALAPSRTERIKWEVTPVEEGGKECRTFWKVLEDFDKNAIIDGTSPNNSRNSVLGVTLQLHPLTGRTHQLRLHCAAVGSGIVGDSLYGDSPIAWVGGDNANMKLDDKQNSGASSSPIIESVKTLHLHAHKLSFPTKTGKKMTFESPKPW